MFKNVDEFISSDTCKLLFFSGFSSCLKLITDGDMNIHVMAIESGDPDRFIKALNKIRGEAFEEFKSFIETNWGADVER